MGSALKSTTLANPEASNDSTGTSPGLGTTLAPPKLLTPLDGEHTCGNLQTRSSGGRTGLP